MLGRLTRRRLVELTLAVPLLGSLDALAAALPPTQSCDDGDDDGTLAQTEGPFFSTGSPRRRVFPGGGPRLTLSGRVLSTRCKPVANAKLDFWHCDGRGVYDNDGYRFRGHQFTDAQGRWRLDTILPAVYPGRTRHIHVKVQARGKPVLTTQLYFPNEPQNRTDGIFDRALLLKGYRRVGARRAGRFDFVLDV